MSNVVATYSIGQKGWVLRDIEKNERVSNQVFGTAVAAEATMTEKPVKKVVKQSAEPVVVAEPVVKTKEPAGTKGEIVAATIKQFPGLTTSQYAKKIAAHNPTLTYANAYYLVGKVLKGK